jgi:hypothetical protein
MVRWPMHHGKNLGGAGVWNFLWRLGIKPTPSVSSEDSVLIIAADGLIPETMASSIRDRAAGQQGWIVAAGNPAALNQLLPAGVSLNPEISPFPYGALAWRGVNGDEPEIVAPPGWPYFRIAAGADLVVTFGELIALCGERQSPKRALKVPIQAPAVIRCGRLILLNGNPFAALQAWLQGQEDLEPWLAWRHSLFWLDEQVEFLADVLEGVGVPLGDIPQPGIGGLPATTVVLRHDLDSSRDTSFLDLERAAGVPGTHAVLLDTNCEFWTSTLANMPEQETAFHYDTLLLSSVAEKIRRVAGWRPATEYRPARRTVVGRGLLAQVRRARSQGIGTRTLHRHASFILYPELIDSLNYVFRELPEVFGGSSFFRGQVLRWGIDRTDGGRGTIGQFPHAMFPFWLPFRMAHAADGGQLITGFESTSVMECEPALVAQMLDYRSRRLKQRVITLSYHPYHAKASTFCPDGTLGWFRDVLQLLRDDQVEVLSLGEVYHRCGLAYPAQDMHRASGDVGRVDALREAAR